MTKLKIHRAEREVQTEIDAHKQSEELSHRRRRQQDNNHCHSHFICIAKLLLPLSLSLSRVSRTHNLLSEHRYLLRGNNLNSHLSSYKRILPILISPFHTRSSQIPKLPLLLPPDCYDFTIFALGITPEAE